MATTVCVGDERAATTTGEDAMLHGAAWTAAHEVSW